MKKRKSIILFLTISLIVALSSTVLAYMYKQTEYIATTFLPSQVSCEVKEVTDNSVSKKTEITVENTSNIPAYIRVCLISYWTNDTGIVSKEAPKIDFHYSSDWIKGEDNIYYYKKNVAPGEKTSNLLDLNSNIPLFEDEEGNMQVIEVFAEAIQSIPDQVVTDNWKVILDNTGNIISVIQ